MILKLFDGLGALIHTHCIHCVYRPVSNIAEMCMYQIKALNCLLQALMDELISVLAVDMQVSHVFMIS